MRIRTKLLVLILVPLLAVAGVAAVGFGQQSARTEAAEDTERYVLELEFLGEAIFAVEAERLSHVFDPSVSADDDVRLATEAALEGASERGAPADLVETFAQVTQMVEQARTQPGLPGSNTYRSAMFVLIDYTVALEGVFLEPENTTQMNAIQELYRLFSAQDEAWISYANASPEDPASMVAAASAFGQVDAYYASSAASVANQEFAPLNETFASPLGIELRDLRTIATNGLLADRLDVTAEEVGPVLIARRGEWGPVLDSALADLVATADGQGKDAEGVRSLFALLGLVGLLLLAGIVFVIYRSIANPLEALLTRADSVANDELPDLIHVLRNAGADDVLPTATPIETNSTDEVGQLVGAFNSVQLTAFDLATEQALGRRHVADMFVNLGRRNQQLLQRILAQLTKLENEEDDPDTLKDLFELDNIVTRMRRNAESLLVLAGAQTPRQWTRPVAIEDAVRAAFGEVEGYERIEIAALAEARVRGSVVADLAHLLAELLENAVRFSDPSTPVLVSGQFDKGRYLITVFDQGVGMAPDELEINNRRITDPPQLDQAPTKFLGLFVVGRLAERHNISVRLVEAPGRGIMARVEIPPELLHMEEEAPAAPEVESIAVVPELEQATSPLEVEHDPDSELAELSLDVDDELADHSLEETEISPDGAVEDVAVDSDVGLPDIESHLPADASSDMAGELSDAGIVDEFEGAAGFDTSVDAGASEPVSSFEDLANVHPGVPQAPDLAPPTPPTPPTLDALPTRTTPAATPPAPPEELDGLPSRQRGASLSQLAPSPARRKDDEAADAASETDAGDDAGQFSSLMSAFSSGVSRGLAVAETDTEDNGKGDS